MEAVQRNPVCADQPHRELHGRTRRVGFRRNDAAGAKRVVGVSDEVPRQRAVGQFPHHPDLAPLDDTGGRTACLRYDLNVHGARTRPPRMAVCPRGNSAPVVGPTQWGDRRRQPDPGDRPPLPTKLMADGASGEYIGRCRGSATSVCRRPSWLGLAGVVRAEEALGAHADCGRILDFVCVTSRERGIT